MHKILRIAIGAVCLLLCASLFSAQQLQKIKVSYPAEAGTSWPLYIAKDGGYYAKNGLDVELVSSSQPADVSMVAGGQVAMTNYPLEQAMQASWKDGSLIAYASPFRKNLFALMVNKDIKTVRDLKGKTIGVTQPGDAPYNYVVGILAKSGLTPRDVEWLSIGSDVDECVAALAASRVDATMIAAPAYFKLEDQGFRSLANISDFDDIYAPTVFLFKKMTVAANPHLPEMLIRSHAEATKRLYTDKAFAVKAYLAYNKDEPAEIEKTYNRYTSVNAYERVPYILAPAVQYMMDHQTDEQTAARFKKFDFRTVLDNSIVMRLVKQGYFEKLFGPGIKAEEDRKAKIAFR